MTAASHFARLSLVAAAVLAAPLLVAPPTPAAAPSTVAMAGDTHLTGRVTNRTGQGLAGITVSAWQFSAGQVGSDDWPSGWIVMGETDTGASGDYDIAGLEPGTYRVQFWDTEYLYEMEWWDNAPYLELARDVVVTEAAPASGVNAHLDGTAVIGGVVSNPTGTDLQGVEVTSYRYEPAASGWVVDGRGTTDATGAYRIYGISPGTYRVFFDAGSAWAPEWWNDKPALASADNLVMRPGYSEGGVDADLTSGGPPPAVGNLDVPTVTGDAKVGGTLTAAPGQWSPNNASLTYQWLASGTPISGATGRTYRPGPSDERRTLAVKVTGTAPGHASRSEVSPATRPIAKGDHLLLREPVLRGLAKVGEVLRVKRDRWAASKVDLTFRWFADGVRDRKARGRTLALRARHLGARITVSVVARAPGYHPVTRVVGPSRTVRRP